MAFDKDLIVVVPDGAILQVVQTLLEKRRPSLRVRDINFEVRKDPLHDASPEAKAVDLLRGFSRTHERAIVVRDLEGSGWESRGVDEFQEALASALSANGWTRQRVLAVVIQPEIEAWLRLGSVHVQRLIGARSRRNIELTALLFNQQVQNAVTATGGESHGKPVRPKEAFETMLEHFGIPRSNALYRELASNESIENCAVPSFCRFVNTLRQWFPDAS
jgi:hypothetical protein